MLSQIILLLFLILHSTTSGEVCSKKPKCTEIMSNFDQSRKETELVLQVACWKRTLEEIQSLEDMNTIAKDLKECKYNMRGSRNILAKFMVDDMHGQFTMTSKIDSGKAKLAEMDRQNANMTKKMAQKDGQIFKLKEIVQNLEKEKQQMSNNRDQAIVEMAKKMDEQQQQIYEELSQQLEKERQQMHSNADKTIVEMTKKMEAKLAQHLEKERQQLRNTADQAIEKMVNAQGNWKIATFVLIGGYAVLILAIPVAVLLFKRHLKAQITTPNI